MKVDIKINTEGLKRLQNLLVKNKKSLRIGILGNTNSRTEGLSNATIGAIHELGSEERKIPKRSFLKMPIEVKQKEIANFALIYMQKDIKNYNTFKTSLTKIGLFTRGMIQQAFSTKGFGTWAPNTSFTIKKKGSSSPLIDTGQLRRSIAQDIIDEK